MISKTTLLSLQIHGDDRGSLIALENGHNLPFAIKRVYYIYGTALGVIRGEHAHKKLKQLLIAVSGSVTIKCEYGNDVKEYVLKSPDEGLLIEGLVWREMHGFSSDCVLMVLADDYYNEEDYIRSYDLFKKECRA